MNRKNMCILITAILMLMLYFTIFDDNYSQEGFTPDIRGLYNPRRRQLRMYTENLTKQANEYVNNLKKTFSWS